ncbi:MAG: hypothetical protein Q9187_001597 [Circinaria calcarea]
MTLFVASLFLPYTIHFDVPKPDSEHATLARQESQVKDYLDAGELSLFTQGPAGPTAPPTPAISTENEEFFLSNKPSSINSKVAQPNDPHSIYLSDPHSPVWGLGLFNQPKSRAKSPPPSSILRHTKQQGSTTRVRRFGSISESREHSHERALRSARWSVRPAEQGNGGLHNAVKAASEAGNLKEKIWVGTLGMPTDALDEAQKFDIEDKLENEYDSVTVFPSDSDFDGHYSHYCKTILWPVFHYQIPDNPKSKAYEDHSWIYYVKINQAFADRIVNRWKRGDVIWIHDYHLLLVPSMVRKKLPDAQIGFFLHVAFPSSEVFRCLAVRKELLKGMLGANLIGFQNQEYCHHFLQTCNRLLCVEATTEGVQLEDRLVNVETFPIGIDPGSLDARRRDPEVLLWLERIQLKYSGMQLIVGRDKLDHVRGVRQKLLAYELFLNTNPDMKGKVVLVQVATSTTEQAELDATVSDIVTRINSIHSTLAYQPLVFLKQDIGYSQYLALITAADVLMITSLREGMNLTSHEFISCQDGKYSNKKHGSLILSEFTGSTSVFKGHELSVNPWDYRQCAEAIKTALDMDGNERAQRWSKLMEEVMHHTADHWFTTFLERLSEIWKQHSRRDTISIPRLNVSKLAEQYKAANRRVFILDYEGTLAAYGSPTSIVFTSPQRALDVLTDLLFDQRNIVYVMSARKPEELDRLFRRVHNLGLIAENGCFLKECGSYEWVELAGIEKMSTWKDTVRGILEYYKERTEGSWIEERHCSLAFHYSKAEDQQAAARQAGDCANHINLACESQRIHAVPVDGAIVVEQIDWSKGTAATYIFEGLKKKYEAKGLPKPDFLMVAGDGRDDEVIYQWANKLGKDKIVRDVTTVTVSSRHTEAMATLTQGASGESITHGLPSSLLK